MILRKMIMLHCLKDAGILQILTVNWQKNKQKMEWLHPAIYSTILNKSKSIYNSLQTYDIS